MSLHRELLTIQISPAKYAEVKVYLSHATLCNVIQNSAKGSEMVCKVYTGGFCPLLNGETKSFFPEGRVLLVRMAACLSGCLRAPF